MVVGSVKIGGGWRVWLWRKRVGVVGGVWLWRKRVGVVGVCGCGHGCYGGCVRGGGIQVDWGDGEFVFLVQSSSSTSLNSRSTHLPSQHHLILTSLSLFLNFTT